MTKVLFATDGSAPARDALDFLRRLALPRPIEVELVSNVFLPRNQGDLTDPLLRDFRVHQETAADQFLAAAEVSLAGYADATTRRLLQGDPGHSIVEAAKQSDCDLIVLGATGHSGIGRMLLGSVSDYVATHASCSVLVGRRPKHQCSHQDPMAITIGYNKGAGAEQALDEFLKLAWDEAAQIHLLGVVPIFQGFSPDLSPNVVQYRTNQRVAALHHLKQGRERLLAPPSRLSPDRITCDIVETDHVGNAMIEHLDANQDDLVVIGDSHRSRISRMLLGSVSRFVLQHAHCSVWIARDKTAAEG
ncbi:MAG: universal stress protein [Novipirellula sp. JB048]